MLFISVLTFVMHVWAAGFVVVFPQYRWRNNAPVVKARWMFFTWFERFTFWKKKKQQHGWIHIHCNLSSPLRLKIISLTLRCPCSVFFFIFAGPVMELLIKNSNSWHCFLWQKSFDVAGLLNQLNAVSLNGIYMGQAVKKKPFLFFLTLSLSPFATHSIHTHTKKKESPVNRIIQICLLCNWVNRNIKPWVLNLTAKTYKPTEWNLIQATLWDDLIWKQTLTCVHIFAR